MICLFNGWVDLVNGLVGLANRLDRTARGYCRRLTVCLECFLSYFRILTKRYLCVLINANIPIRLAKRIVRLATDDLGDDTPVSVFWVIVDVNAKLEHIARFNWKNSFEEDFTMTRRTYFALALDGLVVD